MRSMKLQVQIFAVICAFGFGLFCQTAMADGEYFRMDFVPAPGDGREGPLIGGSDKLLPSLKLNHGGYVGDPTSLERVSLARMILLEGFRAYAPQISAGNTGVYPGLQSGFEAVLASAANQYVKANMESLIYDLETMYPNEKRDRKIRGHFAKIDRRLENLMRAFDAKLAGTVPPPLPIQISKKIDQLVSIHRRQVAFVPADFFSRSNVQTLTESRTTSSCEKLFR